MTPRHAPSRPPAHARARLAPPQRGFSLIEALLAFAITSIGLFGLFATQSMLARSADVAKQRTEAARLAQEQLEILRAYTAIDATSGQAAWADLASSSDSVTTNATFTRSWTLAGTATDPMRNASVSLNWTDRAGETHTISMSTVISQTDPANVGALGFPLPANTTLKRPKNRNINIPIPAVDLGNGKSVYQMSSVFAVVFSNDSGYVVQKCSKIVLTAADLASGCNTYDAFILAGYVSKTMAAFPSTLSVSTASLTGLNSAETAQCAFADAVDQSTAALISGYKYYLCILPVVAGTTWSGRLRLTGMQTGTNTLVCRMQYAAAAGVSANVRNVQPYSAVGESLDNQNYILTTANSCPTVSGLATTLHQACASSGANNNASRATDCPAS